MSEVKKRKVHSPEFKAVGLETLQGMRTANEIGQEYGVHPVTVRIGKLKVELDWLKKNPG
jgi:transposase